MEWSYLWLTIGGNAVVTTLLGLLFKLWVGHSLGKDLTVFTKEIENRNAAKLEILRLSLGKELHAVKARSSLLVQKQTNALAIVYSKLLDLRDAIDHVGMQGPGEELMVALEKAKEVYRDCNEFYERHRILYSREISIQIKNCLLLLWDLSKSTIAVIRNPYSPGYEKKIDRNDALAIEVPRTLEALEDAFRAILHGNKEQGIP